MKRKIKRKAKKREASQSPVENLTPEAREMIKEISENISEYIGSLIEDGENQYAVALALEVNVQAFCRMTNLSHTVLVKEAVALIEQDAHSSYYQDAIHKATNKS